MTITFYYALGQRLGPVDKKSLLELRRRGTITPDTVLEIDGKQVKARKVKGLFDDASAPPAQVEPPVADVSLWGVQNVPPVTRRSARSISSDQMKTYARSLYRASESLSSVGDKYSGAGAILVSVALFIGVCSVIGVFGGISEGNPVVIGVSIGAGAIIVLTLLATKFRMERYKWIFTFLFHFGKLTAMQYLEDEEEGL